MAIPASTVISNQPPEFEPVNRIELVSGTNSRISSVSVYTGRAEITRLFKFGLKTGANQVSITGLPVAMDQRSLRVEGRGSAMIHDVTISQMDPPKPVVSEQVSRLDVELTKVYKALTRARKALNAIETYIGSLRSEHTDVSALQDIVDSYDSTAEKLDNKITELEAQKESLKQQIREGKAVSEQGSEANSKLCIKASIGIFSEVEAEVEIALIYAVSSATWSPAYDIRVNMQTKEKPVALTYKGVIIQWTGEDWTNVPISLETAAPSFDAQFPSLNRWTIYAERPRVVATSSMPITITPTSARLPQPMEPMVLHLSRSRSSSRSRSPRRRSRSRSRSPAPMIARPQAIQYRPLDVSSRGNITATFTVPGLMTIPSDGDPHYVTIVNLSLDADMEWVAIPKKMLKVHLKAVIKNKSDYTLLSGPASIYVDSSFISQSDIPSVSPEETFDCSLGFDPSIRVTYPPISKKVTSTGFMTKSRVYSYTQRITLHNTKASEISNLKVLDQIAVSEDATINVKLIFPALLSPSERNAGGGNNANATNSPPSNSKISSASKLFSKLGKAEEHQNKLGIKVPPPLRVASGIVAQWDGVDDIASEVDLDNLGSDGKLEWICELPAQGKINLTLQWEVTAPLATNITGL